jgi:hypothetical protein
VLLFSVIVYVRCLSLPFLLSIMEGLQALIVDERRELTASPLYIEWGLRKGTRAGFELAEMCELFTGCSLVLPCYRFKHY